MPDKSRSINTKFWTDAYIEGLNPSEKLLFLYCLTSPHSNLLGIYEVSEKRISFETSLASETIRKAFKRFANDKKVFFKDNYIIIPNFLKNQKLNSNMKIGVTKLFNDLPEWLRNELNGNDSEGFGNDSEGFERIRNTLLKLEIEMESEMEIESEKRKPSIPTYEDFKKYALDNKKNIDINKLELKYKAWKENNWKDGNGKKITNWKTKLLNTLPYIEIKEVPQKTINSVWDKK